MPRNVNSTLRKLGKGPAVEYERNYSSTSRPQREPEGEETEHDRYRRRQRRMADQDTSSSLPIEVVSKHKEPPKPGTTFEGTVEKLIEKYKDPREVVRHMTHGQFMRYELRGGEIWEGEKLIYDGTAHMVEEG